MKYRIRPVRYPWYAGLKRWDMEVHVLVAGVWIKSPLGTGGFRTQREALDEAIRLIEKRSYVLPIEISDPDYYFEIER